MGALSGFNLQAKVILLVVTLMTLLIIPGALLFLAPFFWMVSTTPNG